MDNSSLQKFSSSSLARRIGRSKPMNNITPLPEKSKAKGSPSGRTAMKSTTTSRPTGQEESIQSSIKPYHARTDPIYCWGRQRIQATVESCDILVHKSRFSSNDVSISTR
ncbi:4383_t:CDS:1 [Paraglomus occultum]|uniref:4383_t:CDS:1 n=1 Tax=Paraglomus occultum TaxID=144539 RepID=A0A9N8VH14_9GLOM|nr:4383_t:CDS:1 [Paraglomus occultum]